MHFKDIVGGIFKENVPLPRKGFLLKHERERILMMVLCMRKTFGIPVEMEKEVGIGMVLTTPQYGFDPVLMFQWFHNLRYFVTECVAYKNMYHFQERSPHWLHITKDVRIYPEIDYISGSAMAHRVMETSRWYPEDVDITIYPDSIGEFEKWIFGVFRRAVYTPTFQKDVLDISTETVRTATRFTNMRRIFLDAVRNGDDKVELCDDVTIDITPMSRGFGHPLFMHRIGIKWTCGQLVFNAIPATSTTSVQHYDAVMCSTSTVPPFTIVYETFKKKGPFVFRVVPVGIWTQYAIPTRLVHSLIRRVSARQNKYMERFPELTFEEGDEKIITSYGKEIPKIVSMLNRRGMEPHFERTCATKALLL